MKNLKDFAALANHLDKRGFFDAANIIDEYIKKYTKMLEEQGRKEARAIRLKRLADEKPIDLPYLFDRYEERRDKDKREKEKSNLSFMEETPAYEQEKREDVGGSEYELLDLFDDEQDVMDIMASLGIEKEAQNLEGLTEDQKRRVSAIRNKGLAYQWANYFRLQNARARQPVPQHPAPQPQPRQPVPQPAKQPARPSTSLKDPAKFQEYMRRMYGKQPQPQQQQRPAPVPQALTQKDFPQKLTEKDFPKELKF